MAITRAATGSAHHSPRTAFSASPAAERLPGLPFRAREPEHDRDRDRRERDADRTRGGSLLRGERLNRLERDVRGEDGERDADQARGPSLHVLDALFVQVAARLRAQAPDEDRPGDGLDEAVDAKGDQGDA